MKGSVKDQGPIGRATSPSKTVPPQFAAGAALYLMAGLANAGPKGKMPGIEGPAGYLKKLASQEG